MRGETRRGSIRRSRALIAVGVAVLACLTSPVSAAPPPYDDSYTYESDGDVSPYGGLGVTEHHALADEATGAIDVHASVFQPTPVFLGDMASASAFVTKNAPASATPLRRTVTVTFVPGAGTDAPHVEVLAPLSSCNVAPIYQQRPNAELWRLNCVSSFIGAAIAISADCVPFTPGCLFRNNSRLLDCSGSGWDNDWVACDQVKNPATGAFTLTASIDLPAGKALRVQAGMYAETWMMGLGNATAAGKATVTDITIT